MTMIRTITTLEPNRIAAGDLTWPSGGDKTLDDPPAE